MLFMVNSWWIVMFVMVFVVETIRITVMVSIVFFKQGFFLRFKDIVKGTKKPESLNSLCFPSIGFAQVTWYFLLKSESFLIFRMSSPVFLRRKTVIGTTCGENVCNDNIFYRYCFPISMCRSKQTQNIHLYFTKCLLRYILTVIQALFPQSINALSHHIVLCDYLSTAKRSQQVKANQPNVYQLSAHCHFH